MGAPIRVRLPKHEERALRETAREQNTTLSDVVRKSLATRHEPTTYLQQLRLWWLNEARQEHLARLASLEKQLQAADAQAASPRLPKVVRLFYDNQIAHLREEASRIQARIDELSNQEQRILHPTTVAPMLILLQTDLAGNLTNATTPPAAANAAQAFSFAPLWPYALGALVVVALGIAYWQHKRGNLGNLDAVRKVIQPEEPSVPYESAQDRERKFDFNPLFLRQRLDKFLEQRDSEELIRQFCEDNEFAAVGDDGEAVALRLFPVREDQIRRIPLPVQFDILSARTRGRLPPADQMFTVKLAEAAPEKRPVGRPKGSTGKKGAVELLEPEGAEDE